MTWDLDAASSYVLRGGRTADTLLRLCVAELIARGAWAVELQDRRGGRGPATQVLVPIGPSPAGVADDAPLLAVDALLRELHADSLPDGDEGGEAGVRMAELGRWVGTRWVTRLGFVQQVAIVPLRKRGLLEQHRGRRGVRYELTPAGRARKDELDALLAPLEGRRGRRLLAKQPGAAAGAAATLGPAVLLLDELLPALRELAPEGEGLGGLGELDGITGIGDASFGAVTDNGRVSRSDGGEGGGGE